MDDTNPYPHLDSAVLEVIDLDCSQRLSWFEGQRMWIPYPSAQLALGRVEELITRPRTDRMRGLLVRAESNNGKSRLAKECVARYPMDENLDGEHVIIPLLLIDMMPRPDENAILDAILEKMKQPYRPKDPITAKRLQVIKVLQRCGLRVLLIDEIQCLLGARQEMRRVTMDALRYIANQVPVPIIAFSTPRGASALASSDEMINRLHPISLPVWKLDADFRSLLANFEAILPLRKSSGLTKKALAAVIHAKSEGLIGEVRDLLELCLKEAFVRQQEHIDDEIIKAVPWIEPSRRKRAAGSAGSNF